jgi:death-on-curing protein
MSSWQKAPNSWRQQLHEISRQIGCAESTRPIDSETGGGAGIRDVALLESALVAVENRHNYEDADLVACAATYAYHLTQAHAFIDGNKRIAAAVANVFGKQ